MHSIIEGDRPGRCYVCQKYGITQRHHMIHGSRRKAADREGLTCHLCLECHHKVHNGDAQLDLTLKKIAQMAYERTHTREEWMQLMGKNYSED